MLLHQIWIQGPAPDKYKASRERWKQLHPQWVCLCWTGEQLQRLVPEWLRPTWDAVARWPVMQSDIGRLLLLWNFGGVYADLDATPVSSLAQLAQDAVRAGTLLVPAGASGAVCTVNNFLLISPKQHDAVGHMLRDIPRLWEKNKWMMDASIFRVWGVLKISGPMMVRANTKGRENCQVLQDVGQWVTHTSDVAWLSPALRNLWKKRRSHAWAAMILALCVLYAVFALQRVRRRREIMDT